MLLQPKKNKKNKNNGSDQEQKLLATNTATASSATQELRQRLATPKSLLIIAIALAVLLAPALLSPLQAQLHVARQGTLPATPAILLGHALSSSKSGTCNADTGTDTDCDSAKNSASLHFASSSTMSRRGDENKAAPEAEADGKSEEILALPPTVPTNTPGDGTHQPADAEQGTAHQQVTLNGDALPLDGLGPMVINTDGTVSRIVNWPELSDRERETTLRVIVKRNHKRLKALKDKMGLSTSEDNQS